MLKKLPPQDMFRIKLTELLLDRLYQMGLIQNKQSLEITDTITTSAFCKRRLTILLVKLKLAENISLANNLVKQGHIRIGPDVITDPALHVTRQMEDWVTWTQTSKIRRKVLTYNKEADDYDLLQA